MINRLKSLLMEALGDSPDDRDDGMQVRLAAAVLLVEAAMMDGHMDPQESDHILALLRARFGLSDEEARALLDEAMAADEAASQILPFTKAVKDRFSPEQRVEMIEMLWEVAYADGRLHDYEANLVRRIGGLIFVSDQEAGAARKRAMTRLGVSDNPLG